MATNNQPSPLRIEILPDRFERFRLIPWWDQALLSRCEVIVVGVGAIGNEIVKNLAMLGIGRLRIVDVDLVERSNLTRSVLFRERHEGMSKARAAAEAAREIYPAIEVAWHHADAIYGFGWGHYLDATVVLAGLDSREARLAVNRACIRVGKPFFDGAIEGIDGIARSFQGANGPCYECTMSARDWELVAKRRTCSLLSREEIAQGHTPTTPTASSVTAALQVQQALKHLHGLDAQFGSGLLFNGMSFEANPVAYQRNPDCYAHEPATRIKRMPWGAHATSVGDAIVAATELLDGAVVLELRHDLMWERRCLCGMVDSPRLPLGQLGKGAALCSRCARECEWDARSTIGRGEADDVMLSELGIAPYDIVRFRSGRNYLDCVLDADRPKEFGSHG